jgi:hypothetical protein
MDRTTAIALIALQALEARTLFAAPAVWSSRGPGGGGAFFAPSFSPHNANEIYVSSDMSGLYRSTNLGQSWQIQDFRQIQANRQSYVQYTSNANTLYCLDFHTDQGVDFVRPVKSSDGGATWNPLAGWNGNDAVYMFADPNNTSRILISDYDTLYVSNDGGTSFQAKLTAPSATGIYLAGALFDGNTIYVATNLGLERSTDGGASFGVMAAGGIAAGEGIYSLAGAKSGGTTRFFAVTVPTGDIYSGMPTEDVTTSYQKIYSIDVGQANWAVKTTGIPAGVNPMYVSMARGNINTAYVAGASTAGAPTVYKTSNAGGTWTSVLTTANNGNVATGWQGAGGDSGWGFGEFAMAFAVAPNDSNRLAFTDFGYVHLSTDGGATWRQAYLNPSDQNPAGSPITPHKAYHGVGLEDTSALWMTWSDANNVFTGYTDITGVRSGDGGSSWAFPDYGSVKQNTIYNIERHPTTGTLYAATSSVHDLYQSTYLTDARIDGGAGRIIQSGNNGSSWTLLHDFGHPVIWCAIDPTNSNRMYASVVHSTQGGIYVTNNLNAGAGSTWTKVTNPPRTEGHPFNIRMLSDGSLVVNYSARRNSTGTFTNSSGVFLSTNQGSTWADRTDTVLSGMKYWTKDITIDPTDATGNTWWAAVRSGWGGTGNGMGGLYKTTNRGVNWTRVYSADSAESCTINAATKEMFICTLSSGVVYVPDCSAANLQFQSTTYPFRQPSRVFFNPFNTNEVWVASFGYGMAMGTTSTPTTVQSAAYNVNANSISITFSSDVGSSFDANDLTLTNLTTSSTVTPTVSYNAATKTATLTFATTDGNWRLTIAGNASPLASPYTLDFFILAGDANRDRVVDSRDFNILAANFGQPGKLFSEGNLNRTGLIDSMDFDLLVSRYGTRLLPA